MADNDVTERARAMSLATRIVHSMPNYTFRCADIDHMVALFETSLRAEYERGLEAGYADAIDDAVAEFRREWESPQDGWDEAYEACVAAVVALCGKPRIKPPPTPDPSDGKRSG